MRSAERTLTIVVLADLLGSVNIGWRVKVGVVDREERNDRHELGSALLACLRTL